MGTAIGNCAAATVFYLGGCTIRALLQSSAYVRFGFLFGNDNFYSDLAKPHSPFWNPAKGTAPFSKTSTANPPAGY